MATEQALTREIRTLGFKLGIPDKNIDDAIAKHGSKPKLRMLKSKWSRAYNARVTEIHGAITRREAQQRALKAEDVHARFSEEDYRRFVIDRKKKPLDARLQNVVTKAKMLESRATTSSWSPSRGGDERIGPPGMGEEDLIDLSSLTMIERYVEDLERTVDAVSGLGPPEDLSAAARARKLDSLAGVHSREVGKYFNLSQRTIENWRKERALERGENISPSTGLPKGAKPSASGTLPAKG